MIGIYSKIPILFKILKKVGGVAMKAIEQVYEALGKLEQKWNRGISANEISDSLKLDRANVSRYLDRLHEQKKVEKLE